MEDYFENLNDRAKQEKSIAARKLIQECEAQGMSKHEIALRIGTAVTTVYHWADGTHAIRNIYLKKLNELATNSKMVTPEIQLSATRELIQAVTDMHESIIEMNKSLSLFMQHGLEEKRESSFLALAKHHK